MVKRLAAFVFVLGLAVWMQVGPAAAQARLGFVVGNAEYAQSPLPTALNDAGLVAEALRSVGFEIVEGANLNQVDFVRSLRAFLAKAEASGADAVLFVYLSGYGFAFEGDNYFAAVDAKLDRESDIPLDTMRLSDVIRALDAAPARTKIVAIDASRRLPFPLAAAGLTPGLVAVDAPRNTLIGFPTGPGLTVTEGKGPYGPYATAIAEMVRAAGLDVAAAFTRIRARAHQLTEGQQTPWHVSALGEAVILVPPEAAAVAPAPVMPSASRERRPFREVARSRPMRSRSNGTNCPSTWSLSKLFRAIPMRRVSGRRSAPGARRSPGNGRSRSIPRNPTGPICGAIRTEAMRPTPSASCAGCPRPSRRRLISSRSNSLTSRRRWRRNCSPASTMRPPPLDRRSF